MAITTNNKAITAFKNLLNRSMSSESLELYEELYPFEFFVNPSAIPMFPISSNKTEMINKGLIIELDVEFVPINGTNGRGYNAVLPRGDYEGVGGPAEYSGPLGSPGDRVYGFVGTNYGTGYTLVPYDNTGAEIYSTGDWIFQYQSGVYFRQYNLSFASNPPAYGKVYKWVGDTLADISTDAVDGDVLAYMTGSDGVPHWQPVPFGALGVVTANTNSGDLVFTLGDSIQIKGGTGLYTSVSGNVLTISAATGYTPIANGTSNYQHLEWMGNTNTWNAVNDLRISAQSLIYLSGSGNGEYLTANDTGNTLLRAETTTTISGGESLQLTANGNTLTITDSSGPSISTGANQITFTDALVINNSNLPAMTLLDLTYSSGVIANSSGPIALNINTYITSQSNATSVTSASVNINYDSTTSWQYGSISGINVYATSKNSAPIGGITGISSGASYGSTGGAYDVKAVRAVAQIASTSNGTVNNVTALHGIIYHDSNNTACVITNACVIKADGVIRSETGSVTKAYDLYLRTHDNVATAYGIYLEKQTGGSTANYEIYLADQGAIYFEDGTDKWVAIKAPDAVTSNYTISLPDNIGSSGQFLQTDGENPATLSWASGVKWLNDLTDVECPHPGEQGLYDGQVLQYVEETSGQGMWRNIDLCASDLFDFNITSPQEGSLLYYSGGEWIDLRYVVRERKEGNGDASYGLEHPVYNNTELVFLNGLLMNQGESNDYILTNNNTLVTFNPPYPQVGDVILVTYLSKDA